MILAVILGWMLSWSPCPGEPVTYAVEYVHRQVAGSVIGFDDMGNSVDMPIYNAWAPQPVVEGITELQAEIPCEPERGEVCVGIVTAVDLAGNRDDGRACE